MPESNFKLIFKPEVEDDLVDVYRWYEEKSTGLGEEFLRLFYVKVNEIVRRPGSYMSIGIFRRSLMRRFPYSIYFVIEDDVILVPGVFHTSRNPDFIKSSAENRKI